jgi:hypothetical protein
LFRVSEIVFGEKRNPFEIFVEGFSRLFQDPSPDDFTYKTRFIHYRDALYALVEKIFSEGYISKMQGLRCIYRIILAAIALSS